MSLGEEVVNGEDKQIDSTTTRHEEASPPPVIVFPERYVNVGGLRAKLEVGLHDGDFRRCDDKDDQYQEEEAKYAIEVGPPNA